MQLAALCVFVELPDQVGLMARRQRRVTDRRGREEVIAPWNQQLGGLLRPYRR